jgi:hypothetical protein
MLKDFCGIRMAYAERRPALGIENVMFVPSSYFSRRKSSQQVFFLKSISGLCNEMI